MIRILFYENEVILNEWLLIDLRCLTLYLTYVCVWREQNKEIRGITVLEYKELMHVFVSK